MSDLPRVVSEIPGPRSRGLSGRLANVECSDTTFMSDQFPVFWSSGAGCLVTDVDGNVFLDASSSFGVLALGHCHPAIVAAVRDQSAALVHGMGDVHPSRVKVELLELLRSHSPIPDSVAILGQNGSDAVEAALKTAYLATGKKGVVAFHGGYHGLSYGALEPTARPFFRDPFSDQRSHIASHLPFGCNPAELEGLLTCGNIGAVIVEPIQGRGGIRIPPVGWLGEIQRVCKRGGALLVLDEIFTGWGRTGDWFACQHEGVTPDLECVGKIMGGGFPLSACLGGRDLMFHAWGKSAGEARHTYTFLGHPVACAAAIATVRVLHEENLVARSAAVGADLLMRLKSLASEYPSLIVDVRGRGLMIGMELVSGAVASDIVMRALRRGLLLLQAGDGGNVIECAPAFVISENQVGWMVECMGKCLADVASASQLAVPGNDTCF